MLWDGPRVEGGWRLVTSTPTRGGSAGGSCASLAFRADVKKISSAETAQHRTNVLSRRSGSAWPSVMLSDPRGVGPEPRGIPAQRRQQNFVVYATEFCQAPWCQDVADCGYLPNKGNGGWRRSGAGDFWAKEWRQSNEDEKFPHPHSFASIPLPNPGRGSAVRIRERVSARLVAPVFFLEGFFEEGHLLLGSEIFYCDRGGTGDGGGFLRSGGDGAGVGFLRGRGGGWVVGHNGGKVASGRGGVTVCDGHARRFSGVCGIR